MAWKGSFNCFWKHESRFETSQFCRESLAVSRKKLKRGVGGSSDRFIQIPHYMIDSPAWRGLPGDAVKALIQVWRHHNGVNNGEISFACSEAPETLGWVNRILADERGIVISARPLEVTSFEVDGFRMAYVFYESGLAVNVMYGIATRRSAQSGSNSQRAWKSPRN